MKLVDYIFKNSDNNIFKCKIIPNSQKNQFVTQMWDGTLKIRITAIPEKWKANKELIKFLGSELWIKKTQIEIKTWKTSGNKLVQINWE